MRAGIGHHDRLTRTYVHEVRWKPYVGVNGPVTAPVIQGIGQLYREHFPDDDVWRFLGILASEKTLDGSPHTSRFAGRYADPGKLPSLVATTRENGMKAVIHYSSPNRDHLSYELDELEQLTGIPDAWQLNVAWPHPGTIERYLKDYRHADVHFILQVGRKAFDEVRRDPDRLAEAVGLYDDLASYFLFDLSGGLGKPFDPEVALLAVEAMWRRCPGRIVLAGGLGPETVGRLRPFLDRYPGLSWDAESAIRTDDRVDMRKVDAFLRASAALRRPAE